MLYFLNFDYMLYVNDIITFSDKGFDNLLIEDFIDTPVLISEVSSQFLQSKGLRYVPRTAKILYSPLAYLLEKYKTGKEIDRDRMSLYNVNDICTLEPYYDFEEEIEQYGVQLANPMKAPYSLIGVITGWIAIKEQLHNICLSLNSGVCGVISALDLCKLQSSDVKNGVVIGAHFMGKMYEKYNLYSKIKTEFSYALLMSDIPNKKGCIGILESKICRYSKENLEQLLLKKEGAFFIELDGLDLDFLIGKRNVCMITYLSPQTSFLPIFLKNISNYIPLLKKENYYIIITKNLYIGYVKFQLYNYDD